MIGRSIPMMARTVVLLGLLATLFVSGRAEAHSFRPILLDVAHVSDATWVVRWTVPAEAVRGDLEAWMPVPPRACVPLAQSGLDTTTAHVRTWMLDCAALTEPAAIRLPAGARLGNVILTYDDGPRSIEASALPAGTLDVPIGPRETDEPVVTLQQTLASYLWIGVEHILLGPDHLLFVLGLLLLVRTPRRLILAVTGFTVGHSVTLVAATVGTAALPGPPVEAFIALSIVFLAHEAWCAETAPPGDAPRWTAEAPLIIAAGFGLIHGFGFAGALADLGLPPGARGWALAAFNIGVELGQLAFVAVVAPLVAAARARDRQRWLVLGLASVAGVVASYWTWERSLATLGL